MSRFKIDDHKLCYHIDRVHKWLHGEDVYPIYLEVGLLNKCNQNCIFCAFDYYHEHSQVLDKNVLKKNISKVSQKGVRSILYSGEGEPLLHKDICEIISFTKNSNVDAALSTNGFLLNKARSKDLLKNLSWMRVSLDAAQDKTYSYIHGVERGALKVVLSNLKDAVSIRNKERYDATIGVQFLLIDQNYKEAVLAAKIMRDIGVDYFTVKPYSHHLLSVNNLRSHIKENKIYLLSNRLSKLSNTGFEIIFRKNSFDSIIQSKKYKRCLGFNFAAHVASSGDIYPCNIFVGDKDYSYGNINKQYFNDIWVNERRKNVIDKIYSSWNIGNCRKNCRFDAINRYLWDLKNPSEHINFI